MSEAFVVVVSPHTDEHDESGVTRRADMLLAAKKRTSPNDINDLAILGPQVKYTNFTIFPQLCK